MIPRIFRQKISIFFILVIIAATNTLSYGASTSTDPAVHVSVASPFVTLSAPGKESIEQLKNELVSLENKVNQYMGLVSLPDETVSCGDKIQITIPGIIASDNFETAFLYENGKSVDSDISLQQGNQVIRQIDKLLPGHSYMLKIFTSQNNYVKNLIIKENISFDNSVDSIFLIPADPNKGFNYSYYLYVPANIQNLPDRRLLVEGNNSDPGLSTAELEDNAKTFITSQWLQAYGHELKIPVLVPAFPRDTPNKEDYPYLQYLNRGALTTQDPTEKRADIQLIAMIKDAQRQLAANNIKTADKVFLTGYSASSKFADRFAILHPDMVMALAAGGLGGTLVLPFDEYGGEKIRYPVGVNDIKELTGTGFDFEGYRNIPQFYYMGENDTNDGTEWRDCYEEQDAQTIWRLLGRKVMPDRWKKVQQVMQGALSNVQFKTYKGIGHDITPDTINDVLSFFKSNWNGNNSKSKKYEFNVINDTYSNLENYKINISRISAALGNRKANFSIWQTLPDITGLNNDNKLSLSVPFNFDSEGFQGAVLVSGGKVVDAIYEPDKNALCITLKAALQNGKSYLLNIYTYSAKYNYKITINNFYKFDVSKNNVIRMSEKPEKGFNYPYYLFIPRNIDKLPQRRLLVEGDNSVPSDSPVTFEKNAFELASSDFPHIYGQRMQIPVLVPAFPRDFHNYGQDDYTYLQFLNRGALATNDPVKARADEQLVEMIKDANQELGYNGIDISDKIFMTGYSSSGKFVERFTILHPDMVRALAAGGIAGTSILPIENYNGCPLRYPVGVNDLEKLTGKKLDLDAYKKVEQFLYMGELDTNDATEWRDCFEEQDAQTIWKLFGRKQLPDRWNNTQEILKGFPEISFKTYKGIGHEINNDVKNDLVKFFVGTGLTNILDENYNNPVGIDFTNKPDFGAGYSSKQATAPVAVNNDFKDLPQFSTGITAKKGDGNLKNALGISINRKKLPDNLSKFVFIRLPCSAPYTPEAIKNILQYEKNKGQHYGLTEYNDKTGFYYASGTSSCYIVLYNKDKNPLGFAIVKDCKVIIPDKN